MDWIERGNCDVCAVNETGKEYREVPDGYTSYVANRE